MVFQFVLFIGHESLSRIAEREREKVEILKSTLDVISSIRFSTSRFSFSPHSFDNYLFFSLISMYFLAETIGLFYVILFPPSIHLSIWFVRSVNGCDRCYVYDCSRAYVIYPSKYICSANKTKLQLQSCQEMDQI